MPEPVSCQTHPTNPSIIQCDDVTIGPEPPATQEVDSTEGAAGARALVLNHTPPLLVHYERNPSEPIDVPYGEIARRCAADAIAGAVVIGGATAAHPVLGALTALKTGLDIGQCFDDTIHALQREANEQLAVQTCIAKGGTPVGHVDNMVVCERTVPESP
jgi:hypothetical protein